MTAVKMLLFCSFLFMSISSIISQCPFSIGKDNGNNDLTLFFSPGDTPNNLSTISLEFGDFTPENLSVMRFGNSYQTSNVNFSSITLTGDVTLNYSNGSTLICNYIDGSFNDPLPVDLVAWNGILKAEDIELHWSTAWEENNAGFEIERSFDGQRFETIDMVGGVGNSALENHYSYTDQEVKAKALGETAYYRLVQIDYDGSRTISKVIAIDLELDYSDFEITKVAQVGIGERRISVYYYNPPSVRKINVLLTNIQGHILLQLSLYPDAGINSLDIDLSNDPDHLVFLSMDNGRKLIHKKILLMSQQ
jgi:hypothetical protein